MWPSQFLRHATQRTDNAAVPGMGLRSEQNKTCEGRVSCIIDIGVANIAAHVALAIPQARDPTHGQRCCARDGSKVGAEQNMRGQSLLHNRHWGGQYCCPCGPRNSSGTRPNARTTLLCPVWV